MYTKRGKRRKRERGEVRGGKGRRKRAGGEKYWKWEGSLEKNHSWFFLASLFVRIVFPAKITSISDGCLPVRRRCTSSQIASRSSFKEAPLFEKSRHLAGSAYWKVFCSRGPRSGGEGKREKERRMHAEYLEVVLTRAAGRYKPLQLASSFSLSTFLSPSLSLYAFSLDGILFGRTRRGAPFGREASTC